MFKFLILSLLFYLVVKFVFRILIPVFVISKKFKEQQAAFMEQHHRQQEEEIVDGMTYRDTKQPEEQAPKPPSAVPPPIESLPKEDDYIDFEEV